MCGIFFAISCNGYATPNPGTRQFLNKRGPDRAQEHQVIVQKSPSSPKIYLSFFSTVLSLRGVDVVAQPLVHDKSQSVLCWNGEAWKIGSEHVQGNDSQKVLELLVEVSSGETSERSASGDRNILAAISSISGPFALVFYDAPRGRVYYGRDCLGRRSLLKRTNTEEGLTLSSICSTDIADHWTEVEADGIYAVDILNTEDADSAILNEAGARPLHINHFPLLQKDATRDIANGLILPFPALNKTIPTNASTLCLESPSVERLHSFLSQSVDLRVRNICQACDVRQNSDADAKVAILFSGGLDCTVLARLAHDSLPMSESVDLLNVAFQNPRIHRTQESGAWESSPYELCPDRITGRRSLAELQRVCPGRYWRFVEINVPYTETTAHREAVIELMHPHNTEMDLSISYALYFASRGAGALRGSDDSEMIEYTTPAHVVLSGLGADELFAGYQRHATAFSRHGFPGLVDELELDINRLGKRNLGRDDRVISNWGREARFPYLDETLLAWALACPLWEKCGFGQHASEQSSNPVSGIEPGKKVLRVLAWKLGMKEVAVEKKRAIQFGARTAKMETGKSKGTHLLS
ncbi:uncharacterized protein BDZ99DRAFT_375648 [Mytilinidion resinicola]|uniref:Glutamine amidotransferase type-2 domain-containing protein n=1 Tax=Mytilinidion resinicola TaxID=574789 RepID=A0A6A6Z5M8_9PEZI|nr:uncharacterized protein BDZ99DRAFT_375648 [Mytilinidion resinicola]KAF2816406.1 hypothetical protein BDZ99DRAFT_375648 [Mytilinidion resinicola]